MQEEQKLYPIVERWMRREFHCYRTAKNTGLKDSRIDVVGVRDIGGDMSGDTETISIEVKRGSEPFATACGQALGYRIYANRVYLADKREGSFNSDQKRMIFWNYEVARRMEKYAAKRDMVYERRFVCPECIEVFFS